MKENIHKLTLDRPATYQVKVSGHLDVSWSDWAGRMTITFEGEGDDPPVTILTGTVDQAALLGLLRRIYSLGLPLISVNCVECGSEDDWSKTDLKVVPVTISMPGNSTNALFFENFLVWPRK